MNKTKARRNSGARAAFRPRIERLETRCVPTVNLLLNTGGINYNFSGGYTPPDTTAAVGPNEVVEAVNTSIMIKDKSGNILAGPTQFGNFFSSIYSGNGFSDPYVLYDDVAQRFYVGILEFDSNGNADFDIAVSTSNSPTNLTTSWNEFHKITSVTEGDSYFADFPKMGWNADAVFVSFNQFPDFSGSLHDLILAIDKSSLLDGNQATITTHQADFNTSGNDTRILIPSRMHGSSPGGPEYFVQKLREDPVNTIAVVAETSFLTSSPSFTTTTFTVNPYFDCPSIPGLTGQIDDRMLSADWMNNRLVGSGAVGLPSDVLAHGRWYEFDTSGATPTLIQQGDVSPGAGLYVSYPAVGINSLGEIGMTYTQTSTTVPAAMYITGRLASDPLGTMQTPVLVKQGLAVMNSVRGGDYSFAGADPTDGSFWAAAEYGSVDNSGDNFHWGTQIAHFNLGPIGFISGNVFNDLNANGVKNAGEPGLQGWTVYIDANGNNQLDPNESSTTSDANGNYSLDLNPGTYTVREVTPAGWQETLPSSGSYSATVNAGQTTSGLNFGNFQLLTINGTVFNDLNGDGAKNGGEPGLSGWTVYLDANNNGMLDAGETSTTTSANGTYSFSGLTTGTYRVREVVQSGWIQTSTNPPPISGSGVVNNVDFGNFKLITISGHKFKDDNGNGVQDAGEPALQGFKFYLDLNGNGRLDVGEPTSTSDGSGAFQFSSLGPGTYRVREAPRLYWLQTTANPPDIVAQSGQNVTNLLFGNQRHESFAASVDAGTTPRVNVYNPENGVLRFSFMAFDSNFFGGVRIALADMNGDNVPDIIAASGPGRIAEVRIFNGLNGALLYSFHPFGSFSGGVFVASGDINNDGFSDIILGEGGNGLPMVKVFNFHTQRYIGSGFLAYESTFRGGVHVVAEDLYGNGHTEIVTAPGPGRAPTVRIFAYAGGTAALLRSITAYAPSYTGGVWVAADTGLLVTGPGDSSEPIVKVFNVAGGLIRSFQAYTQSPNGVRVGLVDRNGDGVLDIVTGGGSGSQPLVRFFDGVTYQQLAYDGFWAFEPNFVGGIFVTGVRRRP